MNTTEQQIIESVAQKRYAIQAVLEEERVTPPTSGGWICLVISDPARFEQVIRGAVITHSKVDGRFYLHVVPEG